MPGMLPYGRHLLDEDDVAAVTEVLRGDWLTTGPSIPAFEEAVAARLGARFAVSCSSGTAALHLAALALGLGPGDRVVVPAITFLATANAARYVGADVVFADVDAESGLMGEAELREALGRAGSKAKAVFTVQFAGQCVDAEAIAALAAERGLDVVEDACHAIGTTFALADGTRAKVGSCSHSRMAAFSFHPVKTVTMAEGGVVTTNDEGLREKLSRLRNHGMTRTGTAFENHEYAFDSGGDPNPWYYEMSEIGLNYRATDLHCALGLSQLAKLDGFVARRRDLATRYDRLLAPMAPVVRPISRVAGCDPAWHLYVVLIDFAGAGTERAAVMNGLRARGIGSQVHYLPVHLQPYYRRLYGTQHLPGAEAYYAKALSLPLFPGMAEGDVERVVESLSAVLGGG